MRSFSTLNASGSTCSRPCLRAKLLSAAPVCRTALPRRARIAAAAVQQHVSVAHRTERLVGLANEFINHWIEGGKVGPTEEVLKSLRSVADEQITIKSAHLLGKEEFKGLDGLRDKLALDHNGKGVMRPTGVLLCAANEEHDSIFCLMDFQGQATDEEQGTGLERMKHKTRGIVKFDAMLDDTVCHITALTERWQLGPSDAAHLALRATANGSDKGKDAMMRAALQVGGASYFASKQIKDTSDQEYRGREALANMDRWAQARCSGEDEAKLLDEALAKHEFRLSLNHRLWDQFGVLPIVCGLESVEEDGLPQGCIMYGPQLLENLRNGKTQYHVNCTLLDKAVCPKHNIGFTHVRTYFRPVNQPEAEPEWTQEALEVHMFSDEGLIRETWVLRDPSKFEAEMLQKVMQQAPSAVAASRN